MPNIFVGNLHVNEAERGISSILLQKSLPEEKRELQCNILSIKDYKWR
jgi:hypothetical protein